MIGVIADVRLEQDLFLFSSQSATIDEAPGHMSNFGDVGMRRDVIPIRQYKSRKPFRIRLERILQILECDGESIYSIRNIDNRQEFSAIDSTCTVTSDATKRRITQPCCNCNHR
jgi:hypothetical protein